MRECVESVLIFVIINSHFYVETGGGISSDEVYLAWAHFSVAYMDLWRRILANTTTAQHQSSLKRLAILASLCPHRAISILQVLMSQNTTQNPCVERDCIANKDHILKWQF